MINKHFVDPKQIEHLVNAVPELATQSDCVIFSITYTLFRMACGKGIRHCYEPDKYFIPYVELRSMFPCNTGDFKQLNDKTGLFDISENWYADRGHGKTYAVSAKGMAIVTSFNRLKATRRVKQSVSELVDIHGKPIRKPRVAIGWSDSNGKPMASDEDTK